MRHGRFTGLLDLPPEGTRPPLMVILIRLVAFVLFPMGAMTHYLVTGWHQWESDVLAFGAMVALGVFTGHVALRVLIGVRDHIIRLRVPRLPPEIWYEEYPYGADYFLPRATVVSR